MVRQGPPISGVDLFNDFLYIIRSRFAEEHRKIRKSVPCGTLVSRLSPRRTGTLLAKANGRN